MDLSTLTLPQLKQLHTKIARELEVRERLSKNDFLKKLEKMARDEGLSLADVLPGGGTAAASPSSGKGRRKSKLAKKKAPLPPKYAHPNNRELTWSGRGRKPGWFEAWTAGGGALTALENAASRYASQNSAMIPAEQA